MNKLLIECEIDIFDCVIINYSMFFVQAFLYEPFNGDNLKERWEIGELDDEGIDLGSK